VVVTGEGEEVFGVLGGFVILADIVEGNDLIGGSVQDGKVTLQLGNLAGLAVSGEAVKEALAKIGAASCEGDLGHVLGFEVCQTIAGELGDVGGISWCANGGHPAGFRNAAGGCKHPPHHRDLGLGVDPVWDEAEGGESSVQRERNDGPAAMGTVHREWKTRSDHNC